MGNRVEDRFGCAFEQIGEADVELRLPQADGVVDGDKRIEADVHRRRWSVGTNLAVSCMKNFGELRRHGEVRLARVGTQ